MKPGRLRHRITIEQPSQSINDRGEASTTWTEYGERYARVRTEGVQQYRQADRPKGQIQWELTLRYDWKITSDMRVKWTDREGTTYYFGIEGKTSDPENAWRMVLHCIEYDTETQ
jgi:SPP1 family predicted phage head-tail adaptor